MNICSNHGEEIAYNGVNCPACDQIEEIRKELKEEYDAELSDLELDNDDLRGQLEDYKDKYGENNV